MTFLIILGKAQRIQQINNSIEIGLLDNECANPVLGREIEIKDIAKH